MKANNLPLPNNIDLNIIDETISPNGSKYLSKEEFIPPSDLHFPTGLIDLMPPLVQDYMRYSSPLSDVPDEFLLTPFLAITGSLIGNKRFIHLGGIPVYPVIWTVLFANSSTMRKSTAISLAKKPFERIINTWRDEYEIAFLKWRQDKANADQNKETFDTQPPKKNTLYSSDSFSDLTFWEDLVHRGSLASTPGEFTALWSELTRPRNSMKDLALSIFDAEDSIRRNTKNGGDIELRNPVWNIASATTLQNFQRTLTSTERSSGLLQRVIPVCMERRTKAFKALTELAKPDMQVLSSISDQLQLLNLVEQREMHLSEEAAKTYTAWSHDLQTKSEVLENRISDIGGYTSRLNIYGLKFALIFQMMEDPYQPISDQNMSASVALCEWLLTHITYMLERNYIFNRSYAVRMKIRAFLEKHEGSMTRTELMNLGHFDKEQLDRAIICEVEAGNIEEIRTPTGGRDLIQYKLLNRA